MNINAAPKLLDALQILFTISTVRRMVSVANPCRKTQLTKNQETLGKSSSDKWMTLVS